MAEGVRVGVIVGIDEGVCVVGMTEGTLVGVIVGTAEG